MNSVRILGTPNTGCVVCINTDLNHDDQIKTKILTKGNVQISLNTQYTNIIQKARMDAYIDRVR